MILGDSCSQGKRKKLGEWEVCSFSDHPGFLSTHHMCILELKWLFKDGKGCWEKDGGVSIIL